MGWLQPREIGALHPEEIGALHPALRPIPLLHPPLFHPEEIGWEITIGAARTIGWLQPPWFHPAPRLNPELHPPWFHPALRIPEFQPDESPPALTAATRATKIKYCN